MKQRRRRVKKQTKIGGRNTTEKNNAGSGDRKRQGKNIRKPVD